MPLDDKLMRALEALQPVSAGAAVSDFFKPVSSCMCTGGCGDHCFTHCSANCRWNAR